jgi:hypothetical protein
MIMTMPRHGIACELARVGWLDPAIHNPGFRAKVVNDRGQGKERKDRANVPHHLIFQGNSCFTDHPAKRMIRLDFDTDRTQFWEHLYLFISQR